MAEAVRRGGLASRKELQHARTSLEGLKALEEKEWQELAARFRETRLPAHLQTFPLEFARVPGLGPAEIARLAAHRVTTAADIAPERLMAIKWIDLDLVKGLLLFKGVATRAFTFDPVTGIPGRDRKALEESQRRRTEALLRVLQAGPLELADSTTDPLLARSAGSSARRRPPAGGPAEGAAL